MLLIKKSLNSYLHNDDTPVVLVNPVLPELLLFYYKPEFVPDPELPEFLDLSPILFMLSPVPELTPPDPELTPPEPLTFES
jgi:hypothetical protein